MSKVLKAAYGAPDKPLIVNNIEIPCYVLEDGQRVLVQSGLLKALGMSTGGASKAGSRKIDEFIDNSAIKPFIDRELSHRVKNAINFKTTSGASATGYEATILVDICDAVLEAKKRKTLFKSQAHIAEQAEMLMRSFAKVGIIALVDEVTGYQYDREKDELQKILKAYISEELLAWEKRFPDEFYREIFRLNGWVFTVSQIQRGERPGIIGTWTKKYIYSVLPKGVLKALLDKTQRNDKGKLKTQLHRSLTREQGIEHLNKQIIITVGFMNISDNWKQFEKIWNKKFGQQELFNNDLLEPPKSKTSEQQNLSDFNTKLNKALNYDPKKDKKGDEDDDLETGAVVLK